jgi:hypothetical protein
MNTNTKRWDDSISKWDTLVYKELMPVLLSPQYSTVCLVKRSRGRLGLSHMFRLLPRRSTVHAKNAGPDILNERNVPVHVNLECKSWSMYSTYAYSKCCKWIRDMSHIYHLNWIHDSFPLPIQRSTLIAQASTLIAKTHKTLRSPVYAPRNMLW